MEKERRGVSDTAAPKKRKPSGKEYFEEKEQGYFGQ